MGLLQGAKYHVFLTPKGDCNGLFVTNKSPGGFEIRELKAGTSGVGVSYRILAKLPRQAGTRLERVAPTANAAPHRTARRSPTTRPSPCSRSRCPSVVKEDPKPRGGSRNGSER